jgi:hypothetical protein
MSVVVFVTLAMLVAGCESAEQAKPKLLDAVSRVDVETVRNLIGKHPELAKATNGAGTPVLILALDVGNPEIVELLLDNGADPNAAPNGFAPLQSALMRGSNPHIIKMLLDHGANPNTDSGSGVTPLMKVARLGDKESAEALVAKGADVNAADSTLRQTVLHHAVIGGNPAIVSLLVQEGAKLDAKDSDGQTPLQAAVAAAAPAKSPEETQAEIAELMKKDPAAAARLGARDFRGRGERAFAGKRSAESHRGASAGRREIAGTVDRPLSRTARGHLLWQRRQNLRRKPDAAASWHRPSGRCEANTGRKPGATGACTALLGCASPRA